MVRYFKAFVSLGIVAVIFYSGWQFLPPYFHNYQLEDDMESEARLNAFSLNSEDKIREIVLKDAVNDGVTLRPEQIHVKRMGYQAGMGQTIVIWANYDVPIATPVHDFVIHFSPATDNKDQLVGASE